MKLLLIAILTGFFFLLSPITTSAQLTLSAGPTFNALISDIETLTVGVNAELGIRSTNRKVEFILRGGYSKYTVKEILIVVSLIEELQVIESVIGIKLYSPKTGEEWNENTNAMYIEGNIGVNHYILMETIEAQSKPITNQGTTSKFRLGGRMGYRWSATPIGLTLFGGGHIAPGRNFDAIIGLEAGLNILFPI